LPRRVDIAGIRTRSPDFPIQEFVEFGLFEEFERVGGICVIVNLRR
jgi:hypothetical protein